MSAPAHGTVDQPYDVIVIGGGVNGCGIARDCAMRGLSVCLLEKTDLAAGASGASSGMIHGGLRYLLHDIATTKKSSKDSGYIQQSAPFLLFRIPFLMPLPANPFVADGIESYVAAYDRWAPLKRGKPHCRLSHAEALHLEPGLAPRAIRGGAVTFDEWGIDVCRLCTLTARSAQEHGADIRIGVHVTGVVRANAGDVTGVETYDVATGAKDTIHARTVMNAGGPWAPGVAELAQAQVRLRPAKGVHLTLERRISNIGIICNAIDGRSIFIIPHGATSVIGTTDDDYYGDLNDIPIIEDEVEYLLQGIERTFPAIRAYRIAYAWAGVRPTLYHWGGDEDALSRDHRVFDHAREGARGLFSIAGGKLAAFRIMSEDATDALCAYLNMKAPCRTTVEPLPGAEDEINALDLAREYGLPPYTVIRMVARHGARARSICDMIASDAALGRHVCRCEPVTEAEVRYVVRHEWVTDLSMLARRTRCGMGGCQGMRCAERAAFILCDELGRGSRAEARDMAETFLTSRLRAQAPVLQGGGLAQAELARAAWACSGGSA